MTLTTLFFKLQTKRNVLLIIHATLDGFSCEEATHCNLTKTKLNIGFWKKHSYILLLSLELFPEMTCIYCIFIAYWWTSFLLKKNCEIYFCQGKRRLWLAKMIAITTKSYKMASCNFNAPIEYSLSHKNHVFSLF